MVDAGERRSWTRRELETAQDAFVLALRRLRGLEELCARLRRPLDLEHAHEVLEAAARVAPLPRPQRKGPGIPHTLQEELLLAREEFVRARETLRIAEAAAEAARAA